MSTRSGRSLRIRVYASLDFLRKRPEGTHIDTQGSHNKALFGHAGRTKCFVRKARDRTDGGSQVIFPLLARHNPVGRDFHRHTGAALFLKQQFSLSDDVGRSSHDNGQLMWLVLAMQAKITELQQNSKIILFVGSPFPRQIKGMMSRYA